MASNNQKRTTNWKSLISFVAYVAVCCIGISLLLAAIFKNNAVSAAFKTVADILAISITCIVSFSYANTRRNLVYWIIWIVAIVLIVVGLIVGLI